MNRLASWSVLKTCYTHWKLSWLLLFMCGPASAQCTNTLTIVLHNSSTCNFGQYGQTGPSGANYVGLFYDYQGATQIGSGYAGLGAGGTVTAINYTGCRAAANYWVTAGAYWGATPVTVWGPVYIGADGDYSATINVDPGGCTNNATHVCVFNVVNNSGAFASYQLMLNGGYVTGPVSAAPFVFLDAGQSGTLTVTGTNACSAYTVVQMTGTTPSIVATGPGQLSLQPTTGSIPQTMPPNSYGVTDNGGSMVGGTSPYAGNTSTIYSNPASWGSNSPIVFTTNPVAGDINNTLQTGFGALKSSIDTMHGDLGGKLDGIASRLGGSGTNMSGVASNVDVVASPYSTNAENIGAFLGGAGAGGTNWSTAYANAQGALGDAASGASGLEGAMGSPPEVGGGDASVFSFSFMDKTLNIDPAVVFPGVPGIIKNCLTFAFSAVFLLWAGRRYAEAVAAYQAQQTGGVPDLNGELLGFGGNIAGATVAIVVPVVFVAGWVVVFDYLFGQVLTTLTGLHTLDPFGGMSGGGLYLINEFIPVSLVLSLFWARLALYFGLTKLVLFAASASRFLFGK